jgi:predicted nucleic acid-binding Zn ribbon protein
MKMADNYNHTLKDVIRELIRAYRWKDDLDVVSLERSWEKIVGPLIARHTQELKVRNRVLFVKLDSSVIRNELMLARSKLIQNINREVGNNMIDEIVLR